MKKLKIKLSWPLIAVLVGAALLLFYFKGQIAAGFVNGRPIFRHQLVKEMEKQVGKQVFESLVIESLIRQKAKEQNIVVSDQEVQEEVDKLKENLTSSGQDLEVLLNLQGLSLTDLKEQMKLEKMLNKLIAGEVEVTEEEVDEYLAENQDFYAGEEITQEDRDQISQQLKQQKLSQKVQEWVQQAKEEAKIINWM